MDFSVNEADLATLTKWDTPTICNALELVCPERRGYGFTTKHLFSLDPSLPPVCGFARTATIRAALPSGESDAEMANKRSAYYEYVAKAPGPKQGCTKLALAKPKPQMSCVRPKAGPGTTSTAFL